MSGRETDGSTSDFSSLHRSLEARALRRRHPPESLKGAEMMARQIEREVVQAGWPVGHLLGTEPDLIERYGVSRAVTREAIRILEDHMVARMRPGAGGGLVVTRPDPSIVTRAAALYLDYRRVQPIHLYHARSALELKCLDLAMASMTSTRFEQLQRVVNAESTYQPVELIAQSHKFHLEIARLADDPALEVFVEVLLQLTDDHALPPELGAAQAGSGVYRTRDAHSAIADAISEGDSPRASALLTEHLWWVTAGLATGPGTDRCT